MSIATMRGFCWPSMILGVLLGFFGALSLPIQAQPKTVDSSKGDRALKQCLKDAKATKATDAKEVCFTRKENACFRIYQGNHRAYKKACTLALDSQYKRDKIKHEGDKQELETDLSTCQTQRGILASTKTKKCSCGLAWAFGATIGAIGGGLVGGLVGGNLCHATP